MMVSLGGVEPPISTFAGWRLFHLDYREVFLAHGAPGRNQTCLGLLVKEVARHLPSGAYIYGAPCQNCTDHLELTKFLPRSLGLEGMYFIGYTIRGVLSRVAISLG